MIFLTVDSMSFSAGWSIVKLILVLIIVLILAFYTTKFVAKYQNNTLAGKSNIRFIDSYRVGGNKLISIVEIAGKYYALGIGKDEIHVIDQLDKNNIAFRELQNDSSNASTTQGEVNVDKISFKDVLTKVKNKNSKNDSED